MLLQDAFRRLLHPEGSEDAVRKLSRASHEAGGSPENVTSSGGSQETLRRRFSAGSQETLRNRFSETSQDALRSLSGGSGSSQETAR